MKIIKTEEKQELFNEIKAYRFFQVITNLKNERKRWGWNHDKIYHDFKRWIHVILINNWTHDSFDKEHSFHFDDC